MNMCIRDTIQYEERDGVWQATSDWSNSYRPGDGQPAQASSGVCDSRGISLSMVSREMFITLLLRAPPDQELDEPWVRLCDWPFIKGAVEQIRQIVRELRVEVAGTLAATPGDAAPVAAPAQRELAAPEAHPAPAEDLGPAPEAAPTPLAPANLVRRPGVARAQPLMKAPPA